MVVKPGLVEQSVTEAVIEALDEGVLLWLAGRDVVPGVRRHLISLSARVT